MGRRRLPAGQKTARLAGQGEPDRRAATAGLDHQGVAELRAAAVMAASISPGSLDTRGDRAPGRRGDPLGDQQALGRHLVEAERGGQQVTAGVGEAEQLADALDGPVLAEAAVDGDEDAVVAARLERRPELGVDLQGGAPVPARAQRGGDLGRGEARDLDLGAGPAADHGDAQAHVGPLLTPLMRWPRAAARRGRRSPAPGERRTARRRFAGSGRRAPARRRRWRRRR